MGWFDKKVPALQAAVEAEKAKRQIGTEGRMLCIHGEENCVRCAAEDFQAESTDNHTVWYALEEDDLKRVVRSLPEKVREMMRRHPREVVVAGGFVRALVAGETVHDVDIFFPEEKGIRSWADDVNITYEVKDKHLYVEPSNKTGDPELQLIWRYPYKEPYEVPDSFDYTVAKAAVWYEEADGKNKKAESKFVGICHERFYRDLARKMLVYLCDRDVERVESIPRLIKYVRYGYSIDPNSLAELIVKTCLSLDLSNGFEGMLKQLQSAYKAGGTVDDWADMNKPYVKPKPKPVAPARSHDYSYGS